MPFPVPNLPQPPVSIPLALVRTNARGDILWNRPVFKAPPLVLDPSHLLVPIRVQPTTPLARHD